MRNQCIKCLTIVLCLTLIRTQFPPPARALSSSDVAQPDTSEPVSNPLSVIANVVRTPIRTAHSSRESGSRGSEVAASKFKASRARNRISRVQVEGQSQATSLPGQSSTLLPDGEVLLLGGIETKGPVASAALCDPQTGKITPIASNLHEPRAWHTATLLPDGRVLVFGGIGADGQVLSSAESYDNSARSFTVLSLPGLMPRAHHTATVLTDGLVFIVGGTLGASETTGTALLWNFRTNSVTAVSRSLLIPRRDHTATLLPDGTVLLWGGRQETGVPIPDGEIFDPETGNFRIQVSRPPAAANPGPQLQGAFPQNGSQNVPLDVLIGVRFSELILMHTVATSTLLLTDPQGQAVPARVVPAEAGMLAFLTPAGNLASGTTYIVGLTGITGPSGAPLPDTTFSFTTAGQSSRSEAGTLGGGNDTWAGGPENSPWRKLPPLEAPTGVTAISGQLLLLDGHPLERVTLRVGSVRVETDETGRFLLRDVPSGHVAMVIDGRTANRKGISYGVFEDGIDVISGQTSILKYTIWMPEIDTANAVNLPSPTTKETVITTPRIPGIEFHIPAGTTFTDIDGKIATRVSITPIPITQPPFPLPPGVNVPVYFTIQPGGGYLSVQNSSGSKGAWLVYPNSFHQTAGSRFDFWNYDADARGWYIYGHGKVSPNQRNILPDPGVWIYQLTGAMVGGSSLGASTGPGLFCRMFGWFCGGEPVDLGTGLFVSDKTDLYLPDVVPIRLTRSYRPNDGASRAFGVGTSHEYDIFLVGTIFPYTYIDLVLADGGRIHCPRTSSGTSYTDAVYLCNSAQGPFFGSMTIWNGTGWTLTRRDGFVYRFGDGFNATRAQQGALLSITDRSGNVLTISRDSNANITQVTSPNGRWIQFTYDANFRITQANDYIGRIVQYSYDSGGRLSQVIDANGGTWHYNYDASNNMTSMVDPRNITYLRNQYDSQNRVIKQTLADGLSTYQFTYNPGSCGSNCSGIWETDVTDPDGNVEKVKFNPASIFPNGFATAGAASAVTYAAGTSIAQTYSFQYQAGANLVTSITDPLNRTTSFAYDALGNITSITRLTGTSNAVTTSLTYEAKFSRVTSVTDPLNHTTAFSYDSLGNLISANDALGHTSTFAYNAEGQLVSAIDPLGDTSTFAYDGGDLVSKTDPLGRSVAFFTDSAGRMLSRLDALGQRTTYSYNALNQLLQIGDANGGVTSFGYDPNGNLLSVTDPRNTSNPTSYTYDAMDRVATRKDALGNQESYQYDGNGNLIQFTDRRGKVAAFGYDALSRKTFAGFGRSGSTYESTIGNTFDAGNRLTRTVDSLSGTINRGFDNLDRLTSEATPQGTVGYVYDNAGRRSTLTVPGQSVATYTFDPANRLTQISQGTATVSFTYDNANRRTTLTLPNGVTTTYSYDSASELTGTSYATATTTLGNLTYGYDLGGQGVNLGGSYARTNIPLPISMSAYNAGNQLTQWGTATPTYDANGNMLSDGMHSYVWDARNRLVSIDGGATASFGYDPFGRRASKTMLGVTTSFLYDLPNVVQEVTGSNTANSLTGGVDEIFQRSDSAGARNFLADTLGNTLALTDSTGTSQTQYTYEPFGNTTLSGLSTTNSFAYTGRELEATGLYFYRARYYNPQLQRFISEDPSGFQGGVNLYAYAVNNPIRFRDPSGRDPVIGITVGLFAGAINGAIGAAIAGGNAQDIFIGAALGGVVGAGIGAIDPTLGFGTLALVGGSSAGLGDLLGQVIGGAGPGSNPINVGEVIGATLGGALAGVVAPIGGALAAGEGAFADWSGNIIGQTLGFGPSVLFPAGGAQYGKPALTTGRKQK
jgi:RHS repeat-associated protein